MTARRIASVVALILLAAAAPAVAHGSQKTVTKEKDPYEVTLITSARVVGDETMFIGWQVVEQVNGTNQTFAENATATLTFYDADNATISSQDTPANATDAPSGTILIARVPFPTDTRWAEYTLHLPNASVTFGQAVEAPPGAEDQSGDTEPRSTPLGVAVPTAALLIGLVWRVRASRNSKP